MRNLIILLLIFSSSVAKASVNDSIPNGLPQNNVAGWERTKKQVMADSGFVTLFNDSVAPPKYPMIKLLSYDSSVWYWNMVKWQRIGNSTSGFIRYSDSNTVFITPTQLNDSISGRVKYSDSTTTFVTPTQMNDSINWVRVGNSLYPKSNAYNVGIGGAPSTGYTGSQTKLDVHSSNGRLDFDGTRLEVVATSGSRNLYLQGSGNINNTSSNIAIGDNALNRNAGDGSIAIGGTSLSGLASGGNNVGVGLFSLASTDSTENTAVGNYAGVSNYGKQNTDLGTSAQSARQVDSIISNVSAIVTSSRNVSGASIATLISNNSLNTGEKYPFRVVFNGTVPTPFGTTTQLFANGLIVNSNTITLSINSNFTSQGTGTFTLKLYNRQNNAIAIGDNVQTDSSNQVAIGNSSNSILKSNQFVVDLVTVPTLNYVLKWDGTKYVPSAESGGGGSGGNADSLGGLPASNYTLNSVAINTTAPLTGGGNLTTTRTLSMPASTNSVNGYLTSADHTLFNSKLSNITSLVAAGTNVTLTGSGTSGSPYVVNSTASSTYTFHAPLSLSGSTVSIPASTNSVNGYLTSADHTLFNSKLSNITGLVTAGTNITLTGSGTSGSPYVVSSLGSTDESYHTATYGATTTINYNTGQKFVLALTGNTTLAFSNVVNGRTIYILLEQDATGGRTVTLPANTVFPLGSSSLLVLNTTTTPNGVDKIAVTYNNITGNYEVELSKDYNNDFGD